MRLVVGDTERRGRAIDASAFDLTPETVLEAIRDGESSVERVTLDAPAPGLAHEFVGIVEPGVALSVRPALAAAARSRGLSAPQDDRIAAIREELDGLDTDPVVTREVRRAVAQAGEAVDRLRERVAELRGRVRAREDAGLDATEARADLADAIRRLSEAETEHVAATERLDRATTAAREARDARERRLRLEDRLANREREARAHLVDCVDDEYRTAVRNVPQGGRDCDDPFDADPVTVALAVARVAALDAPLVLTCDRFASPAAAADWLDVPVLAL
jgi:hypothetical protein